MRVSGGLPLHFHSAALVALLVQGHALAQPSPPPNPGQYPPPPYPYPQPPQGQPYGQPGPAYGAQPGPAYGAQPAPGAGAPGGYQGVPPQGVPPPQGQPARRARAESSTAEIGMLYGVSAAYGVGLGTWVDAELGLEDPGILLIAPAVLGVAAPVGVYFLDDPSMPRGKPAAIAAGLFLGAAEGLGIAGTQFVTARSDDAWGFRGLTRSMAIGATAGGVLGYFVGDLEEPSPRLSGFVASAAVWGTLIGGSFGYGASSAGVGYGKSNDSGAIGGLVGFNVGLGAAAALSLAFVPSWAQIQGMWLGAGIGVAASLPVYLFYAGEEGPPAKRGLLFTATAMTLGIAAGGVFSPGDDGTSRSSRSAGTPAFASITHALPFTVPGGGGLAVGGMLQ